MFKTLGLTVLVLIAAVLLYAATKPPTFEVQRTTTIQAPPEKIYPLISDFHNWGTWSPWEKLDPAMKRTHSGAESGPGAVYEWEGNSEVGKGRMEITAATPPSKVTIQLDFLEPFEAHNVTEMTLEPQGDATQVRWLMRGPNTYVSKVMSVFMSMDSMIGKDFEAGLANMKAAAEK
jgi:uncharacterized protein YndB with AHSA1/START domain